MVIIQCTVRFYFCERLTLFETIIDNQLFRTILMPRKIALTLLTGRGWNIEGFLDYLVMVDNVEHQGKTD